MGGSTNKFTFKNVLIPFRDFLYPPVCMACEKILENGNERVCAVCWSSFLPFKEHEPVWEELQSRFAEAGAVKSFLSCFYFDKDGKIQHVIHLLKYGGVKSIGIRFGHEIGKRIVRHPILSSADLLIPIPLHKLKERDRGYNQSECICRGISDVAGIPTAQSMMRRVKFTETQTQLNIVERKVNVEDAFEITPRFRDHLQGKRIIIVDDVITTGSTINACAQALLAGGASSVYAASAAVTK